jgi:thiol-disulfide isomerase/thioredoxin
MAMRILRRCCAWALLALSAAGVHAQKTASLVHSAAPEFVRTDLQQRRVDLRAYRGRVVLLTFWATWCAPCQVEMPRFVAWQRQYGPQGLQIIGVSMDDDAGPVRRLMGRRHVNYPVLMGDVKLAELYGGVLGLPVTFLIDRQGVVAARFHGETDLDAMERRIGKLLKRP